MIKKFFKWTFLLLFGLILMAALTYAGFHLIEYATGGKYVSYLKLNSETIPTDSYFSYSIVDEDIKKNKLILVGEIHGFNEPTKFDVHFFKHLHKTHNVRHYIAEFDFVQASLMNDFMKSGDLEQLKLILKNWVVFQGRNNQDYFDKYVELQKFYTQLPDNEKFQFIGIDQIQDTSLLANYISSLFPNTHAIKAESIDNLHLKNQIDSLSRHYQNSPDTLLLLSHLDSNLGYVNSKLNREDVMFNNFKSLYKAYQLENNKLYGFFGLYHVFQYRVNGQHPLASKIRESELGFDNNMLSINFLMNNSYAVMPSNSMPEFMRDKGKYSRMPISADNVLFMYIYGIKDFKRLTPINNKSFIKLNSENNPYKNSNRIRTTIQLLPVTQIFEMNDKDKPYVQYTIFVRNSDWAEPMQE